MKTEALATSPDGSFVVEAPSVEAALEAVHERFGPSANIVDAEMVNSKGIGGFFSKQTYRVRVLPQPAPTGAPPLASEPVAPPGATSYEKPRSQPVDEAVDVVLRRVEAGEDSGPGSRTFGEALHAELASRGVRPALESEIAANDSGLEPLVVRRDAAVAGVVDLRDGYLPEAPAAGVGSAPPEAFLTPAPQAPAAIFTGPVSKSVAIGDPEAASPRERLPLGRPVDEWAPGAGPIQWSVDHLSRLGLPFRLICDLGDLDPGDDLAWVYRLSEAAAPLCGRIPEEALVLIGRDVEAASEWMGVDGVVVPDAPGYEGDAAISVRDGAPMHYIARVRSGRPLHVVCDGSGWVDSLVEHNELRSTIAVVSTQPHCLAEALQTVVATEGVLGYFINDDGLVRVTPFELALAVRSLLPRA